MKAAFPILLVVSVMLITAAVTRADHDGEPRIQLADPFQLRQDNQFESELQLPEIAVETDSNSARLAEPQVSDEAFSTSLRQRQRLLTASPELNRSLSQEGDMLGEFQTIATWSGVVIFLAGAVLVVLKAWGIRGVQLAGSSRLTQLAILQLRPDAQLLLVSADGHKFLVTLDRQGLRFVQPVANWGDMLDDSASNSIPIDAPREASHE